MKNLNYVLMGLIVAVMSLSSAHAEPDTITNKAEGLVWAGCGITKLAFMQELATAYTKKTGVAIELKGGGATKGIRDVQKRLIHIGGACRASSEFVNEERYVNQVPVAWDAVVFIVNKSNPVETITMDQVRDVYDGKITNWKQLGGNDEVMNLYVRESPISGVGQTLRELVFSDYEKEFTKLAHVVKSTGPAEKAVEGDANGFTATGVSSAHRRDVKILNVNGITPTFENIRDGNYMLYRPLYLVTRMVEDNPQVIDFIKYATSKEGMEVIRNTGTVPYLDGMKLLSRHYRQYTRAISSGL